MPYKYSDIIGGKYQQTGLEI